MSTINNFLQRFKGQKSYKAWGIVAVTVGLVLTFKNYFKGGTCKIKKDLNGKVAVITGGNTGIGKQTAKQLIRQGCKVVIGARDDLKSRMFVQQIKRYNIDSQIQFFHLDLSSKDSILDFADHIKNSCPKIDYLVNNAGVMALPTRQLTEQGFEMQFGVNHLGHFYLTFQLWDLIKKSQFPRIINVSSNAHYRNKADIDFEDLNYYHNYQPWTAYARSKLANILFTRQLQKRMYQNHVNGITISLHPGVVRTQLMRYMFNSNWRKLVYFTLRTILYPLVWIIMKNSKQGAQTTLYSLLQEPEKLHPGEYYADCKVGYCSQPAKNYQTAQRLWRVSQNQLGIKFNV